MPEGGEAGLTCLMDNRHHIDLVFVNKDGDRKIQLRQRIGELRSVTFEASLHSDALCLRVQADQYHYRFSYAESNSEYQPAGTAQPHCLSTEVAGGFTGVYFGMFAVRATVAFDWFEYRKTV